MWNFLPTPKCYTLINKMYDPINDMQQTRKRLALQNEEMDEMYSEDQVNEFIEVMAQYIDNGDMPKPRTPYYEYVVKRLNLLRHLKELISKYPRHHKRLMSKESRELRERMKIMDENDVTKQT